MKKRTLRLLGVVKKVGERRIDADVLTGWPPTCSFVFHQPKRPDCMKKNIRTE